jgi:hypothetical protein
VLHLQGLLLRVQQHILQPQVLVLLHVLLQQHLGLCGKGPQQLWPTGAPHRVAPVLWLAG